ncbi:MAG TPA: 2-dehydropantoate 2-reductase [Bradyrhizobium sp.]|nr:2-dehydropantoate 2-reductase [Bradyrhizobium sp.]
MTPSSSRNGRSTIAVIGLGSIGGVVAGCLRAADRHDVIGCVRHPIGRLVLDRADESVELPLKVLTDPAQAPRVDWVLLCTKVQHTPQTAPWLQRLCDCSTRVAVLQNGIEHVARVAPLAGDAGIVPAIVYYNGERIGPDHVRLRQVAEHDLAVADDANGRAFAQLLEGTPLHVKLAEDFRTLVWRKLLINAIANPVTALTLQRQAVFRRDDIKTLCLAILDEAVAVARADDAHLAEDESTRTLSTLLTYPPDAGTSMYFDRLAGRTLEVEALTGAIVAAGQRLQVATPINSALLAMLRAISDAAKPG